MNIAIYIIIILLITSCYLLYIKINHFIYHNKLAKQLNKIHSNYQQQNKQQKKSLNETSSLMLKQKLHTKINYVIFSMLILFPLLNLLINYSSWFFLIYAFSLLSLFAFKTLLKIIINRIYKQLKIDLPNVLELIARSISAGHSIIDAINIVAENTTGILAEEFKAIKNNLNIGMSLKNALAISAKHISINEFKYFVVAINIQYSTGGNIALILEGLASSIRQKNSVDRKVKALASEPLVSALVIGMIPIIITIIITAINPEYMLGMFQHSTGQNIIVGCIIWQIIGSLIMKRIIKVDI